MPEDKQQITMTFSGYDDTPEDNIIMFEGPIHISGFVDTIEELNTTIGNDYGDAESEQIYVYVKNVNDPNISSGKIPYRGAFYMWDTEKRNWKYIILGTHSHSNIDILDQLGEKLNTTEIRNGEKKIITIKKIENDNEDLSDLKNVEKVKYEIDYEDLPEITFPEIPPREDGKDLYLTLDKDNKFSWSNTLIPTQTFKVLKIVVDSNFISGTSSKELFLSKEYLEQNVVAYDKTSDEILVFDSGNLLSDILVQEYNEGLKFTITNDLPTELFETGEIITVLIIKSGIAGIIDTLEKQYITKAEAVELLSNGAINLKDYLTKIDLAKYSRKEHAHPEYLKKTDYDAFDFRYADFQHTHTEYITKEEVLAILLDSVDDDGNIDIEGRIQEIINVFTEKFVDYYTKQQVDVLVTSQVESVKNTDSIKVSLTGENLTDYLLNLEDKIDDTKHIPDANIELSAINVNLGNETLGGYKTGDTIRAGTSLQNFIKKLVTKEELPELKNPELKLETDKIYYDSGETKKVKINISYIKNNGGNLKNNLKLFINDNEEEIPLESEYIERTLQMSAINENGLAYVIKVSGEYEDGDIVVSNTGNTSNYIHGGEISQEIKLYVKRYPYFGSLQVDFQNEFSSDDIYRDVYGENSNRQLKYYEDDGQDLIIKYFKSQNPQTLIYAMPRASQYKLDKIIFMNQNCDILGDCEYNENGVELKDADNKLNVNLKNLYDIYYYVLTVPAQTDFYVKLTFKEREE